MYSLNSSRGQKKRNLQNRRNSGTRVLSTFLVKIIAAISNFYSCGTLGGEINFIKGGEQVIKSKGLKEGGGRGGATRSQRHRCSCLQNITVQLNLTFILGCISHCIDSISFLRHRLGLQRLSIRCLHSHL